MSIRTLFSVRKSFTACCCSRTDKIQGFGGMWFVGRSVEFVTALLELYVC